MIIRMPMLKSWSCRLPFTYFIEILLPAFLYGYAIIDRIKKGGKEKERTRETHVKYTPTICNVTLSDGWPCPTLLEMIH